MKYLFCTLLLSFSVSAQFMKLDSLKEKEEKSPGIEDVNPINSAQTTNTAVVSNECKLNRNTSIPLYHFVHLLREQNELVVDYDNSTGLLNINGGKSISNCDSMISPQLRGGNANFPQAFELKIKPCGSDEICEYDVHIPKNDGTYELVKKKFKPTFMGYQNCLKATGVLDDAGKFTNNYRAGEFKVSMKADSGQVAFVSRGPVGNNKKLFSKSNLYPNSRCDIYEPITQNGFKVYTTAEIEENKLIEEYKALCRSNDYSMIAKNLAGFSSMGNLYSNLREVKKELLLDELKEAKKDFDKKAKSKKLSEVDRERLAVLMKDFQREFVDKHFDIDKLEEGDNPDEFLASLYEQYKSASTKTEKKEIKKKINKVMDDLQKYMKKPYFTFDDYMKMTSLKLDAPVEDEDWKDASSDLLLSVTKLKYACRAYSSVTKKCNTAGYDLNPGVKSMQDFDTLRKMANRSVAKRQAKYDKVLSVMSDNLSSEDYDDILDQCREYKEKKVVFDRSMSQVRMQASRSIPPKCRTKFQYVQQYQNNYYKNSYKNCVDDYIASLETNVKRRTGFIYNESSMSKKCSGDNLARIKNQANELSAIERRVADYEADVEEDDDDDDTDNDTTTSTDSTNVSDYYQQMSMQQMMAMQQQMSQQFQQMQFQNKNQIMGMNNSLYSPMGSGNSSFLPPGASYPGMGYPGQFGMMGGMGMGQAGMMGGMPSISSGLGVNLGFGGSLGGGMGFGRGAPTYYGAPPRIGY